MKSIPNLPAVAGQEGDQLAELSEYFRPAKFRALQRLPTERMSPTSKPA